MKAVLFNDKWRIGNDNDRHLSKSIPYIGSCWVLPDTPESSIRQYKSETACKQAIIKIRDIRGNADYKKIK